MSLGYSIRFELEHRALTYYHQNGSISDMDLKRTTDHDTISWKFGSNTLTDSLSAQTYKQLDDSLRHHMRHVISNKLDEQLYFQLYRTLDTEFTNI